MTRSSCLAALAVWLVVGAALRASDASHGALPAHPIPADLRPYFHAPADMAKEDGRRSPLLRADGSRVRTPAQWAERRQEIRREWFDAMGPWPELLVAPSVEVESVTARDGYAQRALRLEIAPGLKEHALLLVPAGEGPFPAVVVVYYNPETSAGLAGKPLRDFGTQLARRGFVALCLGAPGGDAWNPKLAGATCQPLSFLGYVAANAHTALTRLKEVDPQRIGIVGHSYGGKWAMFGSCLYDKFACAVWSDPGIVFDETKPGVNYWEPWYLGLDAQVTRQRGLITPDNPRTGAYARLVAERHDLHELHALMAPRPFLVSGGAEDKLERWATLNHSVEVCRLLGATDRVAMTTREKHDPTAESNEVIYRFFEHFLQARAGASLTQESARRGRLALPVRGGARPGAPVWERRAHEAGPAASPYHKTSVGGDRS